MGAIEEQPEQPVCIHFTNTVSLHDGTATNDRFHDFESYIVWAGAAGLFHKNKVKEWVAWGKTHPRDAARVLSKVIDFREYLYGLFSRSAESQQVSPSTLSELNQMLATPSLKRTIHVSGDEISESWDCGEGPMAPLLRIALSAADVLRQDSWRKIIECDREVCGWLAIDISRNHSRRYCTSGGCGNIARVQRHYHRHRSERRLLGIERRTRTKAQRRRLGQGQTRSF